MSVEYFLDTNVLVYAFDQTAPAKQAKARKNLWHNLLWAKLVPCETVRFLELNQSIPDPLIASSPFGVT